MNWPFSLHAAALFGEAQSRIIAAVPEDKLAALHACAQKHNVPVVVLGVTGGESVELVNICTMNVGELRMSYEQALPALLTNKD